MEFGVADFGFRFLGLRFRKGVVFNCRVPGVICKLNIVFDMLDPPLYTLTHQNLRFCRVPAYKSHIRVYNENLQKSGSWWVKIGLTV